LTPTALAAAAAQVVVVTDPDLYQPLLRSGPAKLQKYTAPYKMFEV
jgi:hypothetical protein